MKIREGFVSNSSSSSFVGIGTSGEKQEINLEEDSTWYIIGEQGETEFGWGPYKIKDIHSRINFAYIQATAIEHQGWQDMLEEVLRENLNLRIDCCITSDWSKSASSNSSKYVKEYGYIDHQSSATEGENIEIFDSKENLYNFT